MQVGFRLELLLGTLIGIELIVTFFIHAALTHTHVWCNCRCSLCEIAFKMHRHLYTWRCALVFTDLDAYTHNKARNTLVSHVKLVLAIKACHSRAVCLFHGSQDTVAARISGILRRHLAKFRVCKQSESTLNVVRSKATVA